MAIAPRGQVQHLLDAVDVRGEGGHDDAARRRREAPAERLAHQGLRAGVAGAPHVGRVGAEHEHALLAERGEARVVRLLVVDRLPVELEVAGVHHGAERRLDGQADAVGDGVGHADRLDREAPDDEPVPRGVGAQVGLLEQAVLGEPVARDRQGERRPVDRHREVPEQVGERADVVLVTVGEDHRAERVAPLPEIGEVRDREVHARHLVVREEQPAVHRDDVRAGLDQHHVEPDLAQPAQRDEPNRGLAGEVDGNGLWSVSGVHDGLFILPPGPRPAQGTGSLGSIGRSDLGGQPGELGER